MIMENKSIKNSKIGPSELLRMSGSKSSLPKIGDYHVNIKILP